MFHQTNCESSCDVHILHGIRTGVCVSVYPVSQPLYIYRSSDFGTNRVVLSEEATQPFKLKGDSIMLEIILIGVAIIITFFAGLLPWRAFDFGKRVMFYSLMLPTGAIFATKSVTSAAIYAMFMFGFILGALVKITNLEKKKLQFQPVVIRGGKR